MRNMLAGLTALLALLATAVAAQPLLPGRAVPLTETRYGTIAANGVLATNGRDAFLVWAADENVRFSKVTEGERRVGRPIFELADVQQLDVAWTGTHFVVVAQQGNASRVVHARLVAPDGNPIGEPLVLATGRLPRVAFNGTDVALLYVADHGVDEEVQVRRFTPLLQPRDGGMATTIANSTMWDQHAQALDIASNGSGYAVLFASHRDIRAITLNSNGAALATQVWQHSLSGDDRRFVAIAGSGSDYLAVWTDGDRLHAATIGRNANPPFFEVAAVQSGALILSPSVTWSGTRYETAFIEATSAGAAMRTAAVDAAARVVLAVSDGIAASRLSTTSIVFPGRGPVTVWRDQDGFFVVRHRPEANRVAVTFGAGDQELRAVASSNAGTLAVWRETYDGGTTLRAGVRRYTGEWTEFRIANRDAATAVAASDGSEFLVITTETNGWSANLLDEEGRVRTRGPVIPARSVRDVIWAGFRYAVVYTDPDGNGRLATLTGGGAIAASQLVWITREDHEIVNMSLDWDGLNFVVAWQASHFVLCFPSCDPHEETVDLARFSNELQRLGDNLHLGGNDAQRPTVTWDGRQHVIVWVQGEQLRAMTLAVDGTAGPVTPLATSPELSFIPGRDAVRIGNRVAVFWNDTLFRPSPPPTFLLDGSQRTHLLDVPFQRRALVALPNGAAAYVGTVVQPAAPHHGARRLFFQRFDLVPPGNAPDAPVARVHREIGQLRIEWTPPPQPVSGYRVEYRVSDGSWNELGETFDRTETQAFWTLPLTPGVTYAFRVRAFNDNGLSTYSNAPMIYTGRRRAVR